MRKDIDRARELRDALRRLAADLLDDRRPGAFSDELTAGDALRAINGFLATCAPELQPEGGSGLRRDWRSSVSGFERELVTIALEAADILTEGDTRLGACHGPGYVLYFERAPARREWCSAGCGNRARVARHYRRHMDVGEPSSAGAWSAPAQAPATGCQGRRPTRCAARH